MDAGLSETAKRPFISTGRRFSKNTLCPAPSIRACRSPPTRITILCFTTDAELYRVVTHRVSLEDMPQLYAAFDKRVDGLEKVIVDTRFSEEFGKRGQGCPPLTKVDELGTMASISSQAIN